MIKKALAFFISKIFRSYIKNYYDPEGLRSEINENGDISRFIFDRGNVITELDENDNLKVATIRGLGIVAQIDAERNSYYYLNNYHGDVTAITDASGRVVNSYKYDAFGNTVEVNEKVKNRFRYCGEQFDNISNQYYLRARFYNPVVGRFTQEDVYRGDGLNLYAYVGNNPINYSDPSGYESEAKRNPFESNQKPPNEPPKQLMLPPGNEITDPSRMLPAPRDLITDPGRMLPEGTGKADDDVAAMARQWQGKGAYPGIDDWTTVTIKKGTKIWGGAPGQSNFYTTDEVMQLVGNDATKLNQGLQVGKGSYPQFRPGMTQYEVNQDITVGYSKALSNPRYGAGGFDQYFINGYENVLNPIKSLIMTNR